MRPYSSSIKCNTLEGNEKRRTKSNHKKKPHTTKRNAITQKITSTLADIMWKHVHTHQQNTTEEKKRKEMKTMRKNNTQTECKTERNLNALRAQKDPVVLSGTKPARPLCVTI